MNNINVAQLANALTRRVSELEFNSSQLQWDMIHFAKDHICVNPLYVGDAVTAVTCINCNHDCPFAGDTIAEHVYANASKVVMALSCGAIQSKRL